MKNMKRLLSITLALLMITAVLPAGVVAEVPDGWTVTASVDSDSVGNMFDGDYSTDGYNRWTSGGAIGYGSLESAYIQIDFGESIALSSIRLWSGGDYALEYTISVPGDGDVWTTIASSTSGGDQVTDNYQTISFEEVTTQIVKITCTKTAVSWYYWSVYELDINVDSTGGEETGIYTFTASTSDGWTFKPSDYAVDIENFSDYLGTGKEVTISVTFDANSGFGGAIWSTACNDDGWTQENHPTSSESSTWSMTVALKGDEANVKIWWMGDDPITITSITVTTAEDETVEPVFYGWALTLDGKIGVTYYFDMTDVEDADLYTMTATIGGNEVDVVRGENKTDGTESNTTEYYRYTVYVSVAQINSDISATLSYGDISVSVSDYSVAKYCSTAEENSDEETLCNALLTYGYYAGIYKNGSSDIENHTLSENLSVTIGEDYEKTSTEGYAKKLVLGDVIYIKVYMNSSDNVVVNGVTYTPVSDTEETGYSYSFEFPVSAQNLDAMFEICDENGTVLTKYSVYSYILNQLGTDSTADENLKNLCKAIYNYSQAAESYTGWH